MIGAATFRLAGGFAKTLTRDGDLENTTATPDGNTPTHRTSGSEEKIDSQRRIQSREEAALITMKLSMHTYREAGLTI